MPSRSSKSPARGLHRFDTYLRVLLYALALAVLVRTFITYPHKDSQIDFRGFYFGAKHLEDTPIYSWDAFKKTVSKDPEVDDLPPIRKEWQWYAPAPPLLYPPGAFVLMKPFVACGIERAVFINMVLNAVAALLIALMLRQLAEKLYPGSGFVVEGVFIACLLISGVFRVHLRSGQINCIMGALLVGIPYCILIARRKGPAILLAAIAIALKPVSLLALAPMFLLLRHEPLKAGILLLLPVLLTLSAGLNKVLEYYNSVQHGSVGRFVDFFTYQPYSHNQSAESIAYRFAGSSSSPLFEFMKIGMIVLYLLAAAYILYLYYQKRADFMEAFCASLISNFLIGPISWDTHMPYLLPFGLLGLLSLFARTRKLRWPMIESISLMLLICAPILIHATGLKFEAEYVRRLFLFTSMYWHSTAAFILLSMTLLFSQTPLRHRLR